MNENKYLNKNGLIHLKEVIFNLLSKKLDNNFGSYNNGNILVISSSGSVIPSKIKVNKLEINYDDNLKALCINTNLVDLSPSYDFTILDNAMLDMSILG